MVIEDVKRCRSYCVTINNYTLSDHRNLCALFPKKAKYLIFGREVGEKGTPHYQGYIELWTAMTKKALNKRLDNRAWLGVRTGSPQEAADYCKKDADFVELGEMSSQGSRTDLKDVVSSVKEGKSFEEIIEATSSFQALRMAEKCLTIFEPPRVTKPYTIYCYGSSGLFKTRIAYLEHPNTRIHKQPANSYKWWQGYDAHPVVVLDEFRSQVPWDRMLELLDYYPTIVEIKGGSRQLKPTTLYITAPHDLSMQYMDVYEQKYQFWRRIDEVWHFTKNNVGVSIKKYAQVFNDEAQQWEETFEYRIEESRLKSGEKVC